MMAGETSSQEASIDQCQCDVNTADDHNRSAIKANNAFICDSDNDGGGGSCGERDVNAEA